METPTGSDAMTPGGHSATGPSLFATGSFVSVPCPKCNGTLARRSHREGLAEKMLGLLYVYPFRCQLCGHRFFAMQWGIRYHRVSVDRREYHRHQAAIPLMLSSRQGDFLGKTADLSINGCRLTASGPFQEHSSWGVQLLLPSNPNPVRIGEAVVRAVSNRQIGMEFLRFAPVEKKRIGRILEAIRKQTESGGATGIPLPIPDPRAAGMATRSGESHPLS